MADRSEILKYHQLRTSIIAAQKPYILALCEIYNTNLPTLIIRDGEIVSCSYSPEVQQSIDKLHELATEAAEYAIRHFDQHLLPSVEPERTHE